MKYHTKLEWSHWSLWMFFLGLLALLLPMMMSFPEPFHLVGGMGVTALLVFLIGWLRSRPLHADYFGLRPPASWQKSVWLGLATVVLIAFVAWWCEQQTATTGEPASSALKTAGFGQSIENDMALIVGLCVAAPVAEELLYRGLLLRALRDGSARWLPRWLAWYVGVIGSSLVFLSMHDASGWMTLAYAVMAISFALCYEWTGSLWTPVVAHSVNNAVTIFIGLFVGVPDVTPTTPWLALLLVASPLVAWAVLYALQKGLGRGAVLLRVPTHS